MTLRRALGAGDAAWIVAGSMLGAGIFVTPGLVAEHLPGVFWPLLAWLAGGILALCGAAVYGELGARLPLSGGDYQYLARAFGPVWGFLTGWAAFVLTFSAAAAVMARVAVDYLAAGVVPGELTLAAPWRAAAGAGLVLALTGANLRGARFAGRTTALLTAVPVVALVVLFGVGLAAGNPALASSPLRQLPGSSLAVAFGAALVPVFFTYSGWNAAAYVAGEIRAPRRNLGRALLAGTALVALLYLLTNLGLTLVLPTAELAGATNPAGLAARTLLGRPAERILSFVIGAAVIASANVTLMAGARIYYAMAVDGLAPTFLARANRAGVPGAALWTSGVWTALLAGFGRIGDLVEWATLAMLLLSSLTVASLFVFRSGPGTSDEEGFRCPGYPFTPIVYLVASAGVAVAAALHDPWGSLAGIGMVLAGWPVYRFGRRFFGVTGSSETSSLRRR